MRRVFLLFLCLWPVFVLASKPERFPLGCRETGFEFSGGDLLIKPVKPEDAEQLQTVYFFQNTGTQTILLDTPSRKSDYTRARHTAEINPGEWASFATNESRIKFVCSLVSEGMDDAPTDCQQVMRVCQYPRAKFAQHNRGSYWIDKSNTRNGAVRSAIDHGILLRS